MINSFLRDVFSASGDEIFICEIDGSIQYKNLVAQNKYRKISNINKTAHLFDFDICILQSEDILSYNPIRAALNSKEIFCASVQKQINENTFENYTLTSLPFDENKKIIIFRNNSQAEISAKYIEQEERVLELNEQVAASQNLKLKLENQLVRTNLINLVSQKVQEYISTKKILKITLEQLKKTLDIEKAEFVYDEKYKTQKIIFEQDEKNAKTKLVAPVFQNNTTYGILYLYKKNPQSVWLKDEVDFVKNICSLLSTSFAKEELYDELEKQKKELEEALKQLKNAQLQIIQAEKMASLGQLVAGVAHEINTPLAAVISNLGMFDKYIKNVSDIDKLKSFAAEISPINAEALRRIENLVKTLKNFARLDEAQKKKVNLIDGIKSTISLLNKEIKGRIQIKEKYENIPEIYCYPDYINQVFMNIILNACQSIKGHGVIEISAYAANKDVVISVSDTGEGIEKSNLKKIFDFGFTTKKIGQGTGLGLPLSKKIVEEHSGNIKVESKVGHGSTFYVTLPIK